jgi:pyruvate formate lyase activating enzyme
MAVRQGAAAVISTYNEPLITAEWAVEVFRPAKVVVNDVKHIKQAHHAR